MLSLLTLGDRKMQYAQGGSENEASKSSGIASLNGTLAVYTVYIRIHIDGTTCPVVIYWLRNFAGFPCFYVLWFVNVYYI